MVQIRHLSILALFGTALVACTSGTLAPVVTRTPEPGVAPVPKPTDTAVRRPAPSAPKPIPKSSPVYPQSTPGSHTVNQGETLYSIAMRYDMDPNALARWNGIVEPYIIHPAQRLRLTPGPLPVAPRTSAVVPIASVGTPPKTIPVDANKPPPASQPPMVNSEPPEPVKSTEKVVTIPEPEPKPEAKQPAIAKGDIHWQWPARGKVVKSKATSGKLGVNIVGELGQTVNAAAAGEVVYSGNGLVGYGNLIIVKHTDTYLSAYAHNHILLAKEGEQVAIGQAIAKMGSSGSKQVMLHFEIRRNGKTVDPLAYLPKR